MTNEDIENKINEVKNKIMVLNKCLITFNKFKDSITDEHDLQQCENQIQDHIMKLNYLKSVHKKLLKNKEERERGDSSTNKIEEKLSEPKNMVAYEFLHNPSILTTEKIVYRMKKIHKKLLGENKFKTNTEKFMEFLRTTNVPVNSNQYIEAKTTIEESKYKILCLNNALKIYEDLYLGPPIDYTNNEETTTQHENMTNDEQKIDNNCLHPLQSGKLQIKIISISKLNTFSNDVDLSATISVNGKHFTTSSNKFGRWNEIFDVPDDKNAEVDIMVKENDSVVSLFWFKPSELRGAEAFKKQIMNENGEDAGLYNLKLEPSGEIQLMMKYVYNQKPKDYQYAIQRRKANKFIVSRFGHKLASSDSYNINKRCAVCNGFILYGGLQCTECRFLCHSNCVPLIIAKCITKDTKDRNEVKDSINVFISKYNIPHKFETSTNLITSWCCHCGLMLPIGKNLISKCTECNKCCHHECKVLIPNLCGMSNEMAKLFLSAIEEAEQKDKLIKVNTLRKHHSDLINTISIKASKKTIKRQTLEDFHLITVLGRGFFGKVILAEEKSTKKLLAIKMLKKQYIVENDNIQNMMSEKSVFLRVSSSDHPFFVKLHSCFTNNSCIYFVMEYVQGGDLIYYVRQSDFTPEKAKFYSCEVLLALEYLHKNNIVYRDLKLDNILLTEEGHIKITDYGLCKENMDAYASTKTICGTPEFLAPELIRGLPYTRAVDWWTFGVLLYEMLTQSPPFRGKNENELYNNIKESQPIYYLYMEYSAIHLISKLLTKNPINRLGSSEADAEEIKKQPFYKDVDWQAVLEKRVPVPYIPKFKGKLDVSHFDNEFTKQSIYSSPIQCTLNESEQELFRGFSYVNPLMDEESNNILP